MYFIITAFTAIATTTIFYVSSQRTKYKLGTLCLIFWGATLMWFVDHVIAYINEGGEFLEMSFDATLLGLIVVLWGFISWGIFLLIEKFQQKVKTNCKS